MKLLVTFKTQTGHEITEYFDLTPHSSGFVPCYKLRSLALGWLVINVEQLKEIKKDVKL